MAADHTRTAILSAAERLYAARGFLSPGFERLLGRSIDRANVIVGPIAEERLGPGWKDRRP